MTPLDGITFATGIIGSVELTAEALGVMPTGATDGPGGQTAYVATGSHGLAIVDTAGFRAPILQAELDLPAIAEQVAVDAARCRAYVAIGAGGLQVINVMPFNARGVGPSVSFDVEAADADPGRAGIQVEEGAQICLSRDISDDVQLRNVELPLDGRVFVNDVSAPFELASDVPTLASLADDRMEILLRATDTGGNATVTDFATVLVIEDITAPALSARRPKASSLC
ncbi:hypothetical protein [Jannaschia seohaensis]|uniref:Uncharacterized protein n=1 Tax=Jannaschia seohaensis TaxID=475081 RepID=A0A2Y9C2Z2_9RHOB|nr:hypothetical protein [Jannaschia seohaensis]PWJ13246.1 hypothetical protein BCF38_1148 [Jannaschia seohaensis]SSA50572.1 hypothetical protein SAMN05421539_1148 [Jannaschia seohaensis]